MVSGGVRNRGLGGCGPRYARGSRAEPRAHEPRGETRGEARWRARWGAILACVAALAHPTEAGAAGERERVGAVWVSSGGRAQVRSDRPDGNALHVAWAAPPVVPDWELRQSLAAF